MAESMGMSEIYSCEYEDALNSEFLKSYTNKDNGHNSRIYEGFYMNDVVILYAGYRHNTQQDCYGPSARDHFLYHYIVKGTMIVVFENDITFRVSAGQGFLLFPNDKASYFPDKNDLCSCIWLGFKGYEAEKLVGEAGVTPDRFIISHKNHDKAYKIMNAFVYYSREMDNLSLIRAHILFYSMVLLWANENEHSALENDSKRISGNIRKKHIHKAVDFIADNYYKNIKVTDIAKHLGLDPSYFSRIFMQAFEITAIEYIQNVRMESAKKMLLYTTKSTKEIAADTGFSSASYFVSCFKKKFGCTPLEFKEKNKS